MNQAADQTIDANGITAIPGLIDSHSHPSIGEYTPAQNTLGWITNYMHGGVTALISAGELHLPGLPLPPDARTALSVAIVTKKCYDNLRPSGVKVHAGTLLLVPGLTEKDFDEIQALGIKLVKFIFYDYSLLPNGEANRYVNWAHARGIKVKIHSGGVSRSGVSQVAGFDMVQKIKPDIIGHITGGPIPMPEADMLRIANETECFMEICTSGNYRLALSLARAVKANGRYDRVLIGTDTPGGTGIVPRGILREIAFISSVGRNRAGKNHLYGHRQCRPCSRFESRHFGRGPARGSSLDAQDYGFGLEGCARLFRQGRFAGDFLRHHRRRRSSRRPQPADAAAGSAGQPVLLLEESDRERL